MISSHEGTFARPTTPSRAADSSGSSRSETKRGGSGLSASGDDVIRIGAGAGSSV